MSLAHEPRAHAQPDAPALARAAALSAEPLLAAPLLELRLLQTESFLEEAAAQPGAELPWAQPAMRILALQAWLRAVREAAQDVPEFLPRAERRLAFPPAAERAPPAWPVLPAWVALLAVSLLARQAAMAPAALAQPDAAGLGASAG